jgi:hypothetical protein
MEKSSKLSFGKYGGQSAENQNSAYSHWAVLAVQAGAEATERHIFGRLRPSGSSGLHAV